MATQITLPAKVTEFMQEFTSSGLAIYAVGGCVRDLLLGLEVINWDFTTNATPDQITHLFRHTFYLNSFGTVTVKWPQESVSPELFEVTTYRHEGEYKDSRRPETVTWATNLEDDLKRRDFTINAMATDGTRLVDEYGGLTDLKNGVVRAVGEPEARFREDALRMLRAIRFACTLGYVIEPATLAAITKCAHTISNISYERIKVELFKILSSKYPYEGVMLLKNTQILKHILPEVDVCFGVPQKSPNRHHIYDVGTHLLMSLKHCKSQNPVTRLAALTHDIGKKETFHKDEATGQITFYNHEVVGATQAKAIAHRLKLSTAEADLYVRLVEFHQFVVSEELTDNAIRRFIRNVGRENLEEMFALRHADRMGGSASETSWRTEDFKKRVAELLIEPFTVRDLKIDGVDVMQTLNLKPSPKVGDILDEIFEKVISKELENERDTLMKYLGSKV